jgi:hypothetical protein
VIWLFLARSTSHPVAAQSDCTNIPLAAGGAQEDGTILNSGFWAMVFGGSSTWIRQDSRSWKIKKVWSAFPSDGFHYGSLYDDACGHIFPERHEQFSRECYDGSLLETAAIAHNSFLKPQGQRRLRLMAQP